MKDKANFYRLEPKSDIGIEGAAGRKLNFMIIFALLFIVVDLAILLFSLDALQEDKTGFIVVGVLFLFGMGFLGLGIHQSKKDKFKKSKEGEILERCELTDGVVVESECVTRTSSSRNSTTTYFDVTLKYTFFDSELNERVAEFKHTYSTPPRFHKGQNLMIAFNKTDSLILNKFTLKAEDEEKLKQKEDERALDDFDNITGEVEELNMARPIESAEFYKKSIIGGRVLIGFGVAIFIIIAAISFVVRIPAFQVIITLIIIAIALVPSSLMCIGGITTLRAGLKKRNYFNAIMANNPKFTFGMLFSSEKTYRAKNEDVASYCFIDDNGNKHTHTTSSETLLEKLQDEQISILVAYDSQLNSAILQHYYFKNYDTLNEDETDEEDDDYLIAKEASDDTISEDETSEEEDFNSEHGLF